MSIGAEHRTFRLRDRMTPMGLSILVNACLLALLVRAFTVCGGPAQRCIDVELQLPVHAATHTVVKPRIKQIVMPAQVVPAHPERPQEIRKPQAQPEPKSEVLASKQETRHLPLTPREPQPRGTTLSIPRFDSGPAHGDGASTGSTGGGGISSGAGPGAYVGPSTGGGSVGHGGGTTSNGHGSGNGRGAQPPQVRESRPPAPEPPKPAPKGESRSARLSRQSKPTYPPDVREEGVEGTVTLDVSIGRDGRVDSARVTKSSGDRRLDRAAAEAVRRWTYEPGLEDGVPSESSVRVRVEFRLE